MKNVKQICRLNDKRNLEKYFAIVYMIIIIKLPSVGVDVPHLPISDSGKLHLFTVVVVVEAVGVEVVVVVPVDVAVVVDVVIFVVVIDVLAIAEWVLIIVVDVVKVDDAFIVFVVLIVGKGCGFGLTDVDITASGMLTFGAGPKRTK